VINENSFDYIIFDTRGGTDHTSIGTAQAAGSFIMVTEADKPSWDMGGLFYNTIDEIESNQITSRAGFIINKNVLPSEAIEVFLRKQWEAPHLTTIPLDENAIRFFQEDKVPVAWDIGCSFSRQLLNVIRKLYVSPKWSAENINKLKALEDTANKIFTARIQEQESNKRAEKFTLIIRIYGTIVATFLLASPVFFKATNIKTDIDQAFIIIAAILIFLMVISDSKIMKMYLNFFAKLLPKNKLD